jgi:hypothetical protein
LSSSPPPTSIPRWAAISSMLLVARPSIPCISRMPSLIEATCASGAVVSYERVAEVKSQRV